MGIFNPSSSISATITGFASAPVSSAICTSNGVLRFAVGDTTGNIIKIKNIIATIGSKTVTFTPNATIDPNPTIAPGNTYTFSVPNVCPSAGTHFSAAVTINYTEPGSIFPSAVYPSSGTITGTVSASTAQSYVANFNGVNSYITTSLLYPSGNSQRNFSLSLWFMPKSGAPSSFYNGLFDSDNGNNGWGLMYWPDTHRLDFWILSTVSGTVQDMEFGNLINGSWVNVVITYNKTPTGYIGNGYINGVLISSNVLRSPVTLPMPYGFNIGRARQSSGSISFGLISGVQLYNSTLTSSQVTELYNNGIGGRYLNNLKVIGFWPLNGTAKDYSGNGNNGVATNVIFTSNYPTP